ncbi:MAG: biotin transporter BioY, partial [Candidatus Eremiobacteraeota bacterium]|nr:biotin transporter BioY [Candidatus Eremiobacteraeota bacterium]
SITESRAEHGMDLAGTGLRLGICILFAILIGLGGWMRIPLPWTPVPVTMQTFFVFLAASLLGADTGTAAVFLYLIMGVLGLPVFSGGTSGTGVLIGPTGGYLVGFFIATMIVGWMVSGHEKVSNFRLISALIIGNLIIYTCGLIILVCFFPGGKPVHLLIAGVLPFIPGDIIKLIGVFIIYRVSVNKVKKLIS